jgi:hypothetical protein
MRVITRKERPHPGAQLRFTDADGMRVTAFATNTARGQLADLELRHRRPARCEDRIRCAKDTGSTNLPLHEMDQNRIWCAIVSLACEITAWLQMLPDRPPGQRSRPLETGLCLESAGGGAASMGDGTTILFGLPGVAVRDVEQGEMGERTVHVVTADPTAAACPVCGVFSTSVRQYRTTAPKDPPTARRRLRARWRTAQHRCRESGCPRPAFTESIAELPPGARARWATAGRWPGPPSGCR